MGGGVAFMETYQWIDSLQNKVNNMKNIKCLTYGFKVEAKSTIEEVNISYK